MAEKLYKLEAYDKDDDVYTLIWMHPDIDFLKQLGSNLWTNFNLSDALKNQPIDWLMISTELEETPVCFLDEHTQWQDYGKGENA